MDITWPPAVTSPVNHQKPFLYNHQPLIRDTSEYTLSAEVWVQHAVGILYIVKFRTGGGAEVTARR